MKKIITVALAILVVFAAFLSANGTQESDNYPTGQGRGLKDGSGSGRGRGQGQGKNNNGNQYREDFTNELVQAYQDVLGSGILTDSDKAGLLVMVEEEKLARDVYTALYDKWKTPIFNNIASSEQQHMDAVKLLLEAYDLNVPSEIYTAGTFMNEELQNYYNELTEKGFQSIETALQIGATIEDLDIADLQRFLTESENDEVKLLYQNLMKGSRNHMRSFTMQLDRYDIAYKPEFISNDYYEKILKYNRETAVITDPDYSL